MDELISKVLLEQRNQEDMQRTVLSALSKAGFFSEAAFYGGTCLRFLHGLNRFSEDLDFSLLRKDPTFSLEKYFPAIVKEFESKGRRVEITKKDKQSFGKVQSAFLKDCTDTYDLRFQTERTPKIKIETDFLPPLEFSTETHLLPGEDGVSVRALSLPSLFAGKMHALMFRQWQHRVKGRDWYDFEWYVKRGVSLDFGHFIERSKDFNGVVYTSPEEFLDALRSRIQEVDFKAAKEDVRPFIKDAAELEAWSTAHFLSLMEIMGIDASTVHDIRRKKTPMEFLQSLYPGRQIVIEATFNLPSGVLFHFTLDGTPTSLVTDRPTSDISVCRGYANPSELCFRDWKTIQGEPAISVGSRVMSLSHKKKTGRGR